MELNFVVNLSGLQGLLSKPKLIRLERLVSIRAAKAFRLQLIENIRRNKYKFSLAVSTIRKRIKLGKNFVPLIVTGEYINSILENEGKVFNSKGRHSGGLSYSELSFILEYGRRDMGIGSFPAWRLTFEDMKPELNRLVNSTIKDFTGLKINDNFY